MKILIVSESDIAGGAAKAAYRLHQSLIRQNIDSQMLVQRKKSDDYTILSNNGKVVKHFNRLRPILDGISNRFYKNKIPSLFSPSQLGFNGISKAINDINPDIVHLHWIAGGMLRVEEISKIRAPIVWSLHDMWPFTGGCHYDHNCGSYKGGCESCLVLGSQNKNDLSSKVFKRKLNTYLKIQNMSVVATSRWIEKCAKESVLLGKRNIFNLPNPLDTDIFRPIDKNIAKDFFNIPKYKTVILFGAMSSISDPRKGSNELFKAIDALNLKDVVLVVAGSSKPKKPLKLKYPVYFIPPLVDEVSLPLVYNTADVMIVPSLQENLANSIIESLSCGVPVVAFNIGGNSDMIKHKVNGYLARPFSITDMAYGIEWLLANNKSHNMSCNARERAVHEFDHKLVSIKYIDLYKKILHTE